MHSSSSYTAAAPRIYLDLDEAKREKTKKDYHHHVFRIPSLRAFGLPLIALAVLAHNLYLTPTPSAWPDFERLLTLYMFYIVVSWLILRVFYSKVQKFHLGLFFLLFDIILFLVAIYYSGGEKSWLFFLLMVRTADQTRTTKRNTMLFAIASTASYMLLMLYLAYFERRALSLPAELTKVSFIFGSNMYLSFVAEASDYLRKSMISAIRVSRDLIRQLESRSSALLASERDYRALVEGSIQGIFIHQHGVIQLANPAVARIFGYESADVLVGLGYITLVAEQERDRLEGYVAAFKEGLSDHERFEYMGVRRDGTFVWIECLVSHVMWRGAPAVQATLQDITARREAEEERRRLAAHLQQVQKLEALGTLAGGIAHDFNNILAAIMGFTELSLFKISEDNPVRSNLEQVLKAASRASEVVKQILTFTRRGVQERKPVRIAPIVLDALKLLRSSLPSTIEIRQEVEAGPGQDFVLADPGQIHQVLMNLGANAGHAMRNRGGALAVKLSVMSHVSQLPTHPELKAGLYTCVTVSDTGDGMDSAVLQRIFDPYFTTKGPGEGTGLGLSVVQGIVKSHSGAITVRSEPGRGTAFTVYLPGLENVEAEDVKELQAVATGSGRILLVDDEEALVDFGKETLEALGYQVTATTSSLDALESFRAQPDAFDLVITDMTMPFLNGRGLTEKIIALRSDTPIILSTGFSDLLNEEQAKEAGIREFVMKPYEIRTLAGAVRKALEQK
jgi:PAS domain S-box-containing protein